MHRYCLSVAAQRLKPLADVQRVSLHLECATACCAGKDESAAVLTALKTAVKTAVKTQILARPIRPSRLVEGPVVVAGMFRTASGLGQSAWSCFEGLRASGVEVTAVDLSEAFNQADLPPDDRLTVMPDARNGTLILHANWPETVPALMHLGLRRKHRWRIIGYWAWELEAEPHGARPASRFLSEIWTPSQFCAGAFSGLRLPVHCVPHRVVTGSASAESGKPKTCLVMADGRSSLDRKNVQAAIAIFGRAFGNDLDWQLVVKCRNLDSSSQPGSDIIEAVNALDRARLVTETLSPADLDSLIQDCDILLSAHRSEGFGLHLAEAMARGKCVAATGWSGNVDFMTPENSLLLPFSLGPVEDRAGIYSDYADARWAEVEIDGAAIMLADVAGDAARRTALGERARQDIAAALDGHGYAIALGGTAKHPTG